MVHERAAPSDGTVQGRNLTRLTHQVVSHRREAIGSEHRRWPAERVVPEMARERDPRRASRICGRPAKGPCLRLFLKWLPQGPRSDERRKAHRAGILEGRREPVMRKGSDARRFSAAVPTNGHALKQSSAQNDKARIRFQLTLFHKIAENSQFPERDTRACQASSRRPVTVYGRALRDYLEAGVGIGRFKPRNRANSAHFSSQHKLTLPLQERAPCVHRC